MLITNIFRVDATDGSLYPVSMLDRKQTIYVFNKDLCRRFPLTYVKDLEVKFDDV